MFSSRACAALPELLYTPLGCIGVELLAVQRAVWVARVNLHLSDKYWLGLSSDAPLTGPYGLGSRHTRQQAPHKKEAKVEQYGLRILKVAGRFTYSQTFLQSCVCANLPGYRMVFQTTHTGRKFSSLCNCKTIPLASQDCLPPFSQNSSAFMVPITEI